MRILTGDDCGLLKESIPELSRSNEGSEESQPSVEMGVSRLGDENGGVQMSRTRGVVGLSFCQFGSSNDNADDGSLSFCAFRADGSLEKWEGFSPYKSKEDRICGGTYKLSKTIGNVFDANETDNDNYTGKPIAMCSAYTNQIVSTQNTPRNIVACCTSTGLISVVDSNAIEKGVVARYDTYGKGNRSDPSTIGYTKGKFLNRDIATSLAMSIDSKSVVVGGRERAATMMDVETGKQTWKAKNLSPNPQTLLQQPIWATAIEFLSKTDTTPINGSHDLLAIGTAYKQLQIYDIRSDATQRRPVLYTPEWDSTKKNVLEHRVTSLCQLDSNCIVVGDAAGYMHTLDLRKISNKNGRSLSASTGRFNGPAGSIRQIVKHETLPIIACVGLDRMMRTFDINKRKQLDCVYLKQRLNCMLFCSDGTWDSNGSLDDDDASEVGSEEESETEAEGNIDDKDEVEDYVDSSEGEGGGLGDESDDADASDMEGEVMQRNDEAPKSKRRRK